MPLNLRTIFARKEMCHEQAADYMGEQLASRKELQSPGSIRFCMDPVAERDAHPEYRS